MYEIFPFSANIRIPEKRYMYHFSEIVNLNRTKSAKHPDCSITETCKMPEYSGILRKFADSYQ